MTVTYKLDLDRVTGSHCGSSITKICTEGEEGLSQMRTKADKGEGGCKSYIFSADVFYGWPGPGH